MSAMTSQIADVLIVYSAVCSNRSKKTSKLRVTGLCEGNSPVTGEFPAQRASNAENVSIWWRHHANCRYHKVALHIRTSPWYSSNNSKVSVVTVKSSQDITTPNSTKIQFSVFEILAIHSYRDFAHATTAVSSRYTQYYDVIRLSRLCLSIQQLIFRISQLHMSWVLVKSSNGPVSGKGWLDTRRVTVGLPLAN